MTSFLVPAAVYAGGLIFAAGCIARIVQYARTPLHLRWELYPVPHEAPKRAEHGGSYFEETRWWTQRQRFHAAGDLRAMVPEMFFLKALWQFNRRLWYASFVFHFGLYLAIASALLVAVAAMVAGVAPAAAGGVAVIYRVLGWTGAVMTLAGALALLLRRLRSAELRNYTTPADVANLIFFVITFATLTAGYLLRPAGIGAQAMARALLRFDGSASFGGVFSVGLVMAAALAAYIPFTHMSHFIAKYFTYHEVRWDDRANVRGGALEAKLGGYFAYRPTWAATHFGADGKKTWAEIVASDPAEVRK